MAETSMACTVNAVKSPVNPFREFTDNTVTVGHDITILAGDQVNQYCNWEHILRFNGGELPIDEITLSVNLHYVVAGSWHRDYRSPPFTWEKARARWVVGPIVGNK